MHGKVEVVFSVVLGSNKSTQKRKLHLKIPSNYVWLNLPKLIVNIG